MKKKSKKDSASQTAIASDSKKINILDVKAETGRKEWGDHIV